jgi:mutator protein MutT
MKKYSNKKIACVAIIKNSDNKILAVSRKNNPEDLGLPGGKADDGEEPYDCMVREVKEETGLTVAAAEETYRANIGNTEVICFTVLAWGGKLSTEEAGVLKWVSSEDLTSNKCSFASYNTNALK